VCLCSYAYCRKQAQCADTAHTPGSAQPVAVLDGYASVTVVEYSFGVHIVACHSGTVMCSGRYWRVVSFSEQAYVCTVLV
jgi:hypothetical protein